MFTTRMRPLRHHAGQVVDHGLVWCPRASHDVELARCLSCPRLQDLTEVEDRLLVECRPRPTMDPDFLFGRGIA